MGNGRQNPIGKCAYCDKRYPVYKEPAKFIPRTGLRRRVHGFCSLWCAALFASRHLEELAKQCPACLSWSARQATKCPYCDHAYEVIEWTRQQHEVGQECPKTKTSKSGGS